MKISVITVSYNAVDVIEHFWYSPLPEQRYDLDYEYIITLMGIT